jgi:hypothetical protein
MDDLRCGYFSRQGGPARADEQREGKTLRDRWIELCHDCFFSSPERRLAAFPQPQSPQTTSIRLRFRGAG